MGNDDDFTLARVTNDDYPFMSEDKRLTHSRFNQTYKGIKVEYAEMFIHHKNGIIKLINAKLAEGLNMTTTPSLDESTALASAIDYLGAGNTYAWQDSAYVAQYREEMEDSAASLYPKGELIIAKKDDNQDYSPEGFVLTWKFNITSLNPDFDSSIYINANTGQIVKLTSNVDKGHADLAHGYGNNVYIDTRWHGSILGSNWILRSNDDNAPRVWTKESYYITHINFTKNAKDGDDEWGTDHQIATTAHWITTKAWNYFENTFDRNGYDGDGSEVKVITECHGTGAEWKRNKRKIFLMLDDDLNPLVNIGITSHEFTHGVAEYTANFAQAKGPSALNESFSDIFGLEVKRSITGQNDNWIIGENSNYSERHLNNPHADSHPSVYEGQYWSRIGEPHINGAVQSYWFYLLSAGSVNAPDGTYNNISVDGIGRDKASNIAFYNLDNFLGKNSDYLSAKLGAVSAAQIIYGQCSNEWEQTINAWAAVGIGVPFTDNVTISGPLFIFYSNNSGPSVPVNYVASGGYDTRAYIWSYSGPWSYQTLASSSQFSKTFQITNFNSQYPYLSTISVKSRRCSSTITKNIYMMNRDLIIILSPNPVQHVLQVSLSLPEVNQEHPVRIQVTNSKGNIMYQGYKYSKEFQIDAEAYPVGNYFLNVTQDEEVFSKQFTKL